MTSDEPHLPPRHLADGLPPYAPRPVEVPAPTDGDAPGSATPSEGAESSPAGQRERSPEQAEEAAAYAEAHEQGLLSDADWAQSVADQDAAHDAAGMPSGSAPADPQLQPDPGLEPGAEPDPANAVLPTPEDVLWTEPTAVLPIQAQPTDAEVHGAEQESARQRRQRRAASRLAATKHGGFRDEPVRTLIRGLGQTLITIGVVLLLFVVYEVYVTDLFGAQKQAAAKESMEERWEATTEAPPPPEPSETAEAVTVAPPSEAQVADPIERTRKYSTEIGQGFANINIPAFGADYSFTIVEGTTTEDLYGNPGHYDNTQYPGELGNFAVAGHRVSKGSPFNALGELQSCDALIIETQDDWFIYRVLPMTEEMSTWNPASRAQCADVAPLTDAYQGLPGREITVPSDYAQVLPIPRVNAAGPEALAAATQRIITLTTCHPQFSDAERMIVHGVLTKTYAKADGFVPPELSE